MGEVTSKRSRCETTTATKTASSPMPQAIISFTAGRKPRADADKRVPDGRQNSHSSSAKAGMPGST